MKKNSHDFSIPQRQSLSAIVLIIYKFYRVLIRQLFPFIIILLIGGNSSRASWEDYLLYGIIVISSLSMIGAIVSYFKYYFHIADDELIVEQGIFQKKKTAIPFDRIQTLNMEQNLFHQLLNVVKLEVDTAGTAKNEFQFDALRKGVAGALRKEIMERKKVLDAGKDENTEDQESILEEEETYHSILNISVSRLLKIGVTENHFKSGGLILAFLFYIWQTADEVGYGSLEVDKDVIGNSSIMIFLVIVIVFMLFSFIISLIRTVLTYFNLKFLRSSDGFMVSSGLLTRKNITAKDHKIQMTVFADNVLQKLLGYKNLMFKQASSVEINNKKSITVPGCNQNHIDLVLSSLYRAEDIQNIEMYPVDKRYLYRMWLYLSIVPLILVSLGFILGDTKLVLIGGGIGIYLGIWMYLKYRKTYFGFNHEMIRINGGIFGDSSTILPIYKIQSVQLYHTPYQRRNNLASLKIRTASSGTSIPYIDHQLAQDIYNYFLYRVESDRRSWM